jgi:parvulin-like peptidyl-prolyl isomerase
VILRRPFAARLVLIAALIVPPVSAAPISRQDKDEGSTALAEARGVTITPEDWSAALERSPRIGEARFASRGEAEDHLKRVLLDLLSVEVNAREMEEAGLLEAPHMEAKVRDNRLTAIALWVRAEVLIPSIEIAEEDIRERYEEQIDLHSRPDRLRARHIFLDLSGLSEEEASAERTLARRIVAELREDPSRFDALEHEHSDSASENIGLTVGPLDRDRTHPEIAEALWELAEGEISDPLEGPFGLHIFRVEQRIRRGRTLEQQRVNIRSTIQREEVDRLLAAARASAETEHGLTLPSPPERIAFDTVIVGGHEAITGEDLALINDLDAEGLAALDRPVVNRMFRQLQTRALYLALGREAVVERSSELQREIELQRKHFIGGDEGLIWDHRAEQAATITDEQVREIYDQNLDFYTEPERWLIRDLELRPAARGGSEESVPVREILEEAQAIRGAWEEGEPFDELIRHHSTAGDAEEGETARWVSFDQPDGFEFRPLRGHLATGEVSQPLRLSDGYRLVQLLEIERDHRRPFEEVEESIRDGLEQNRMRRIRYEFWQALEEETVWSISDEVISPFLESQDPATQ